VSWGRKSGEKRWQEFRHARESGHPWAEEGLLQAWIPACAGMTGIRFAEFMIRTFASVYYGIGGTSDAIVNH
jgi:hypothetical protein